MEKEEGIVEKVSVIIHLRSVGEAPSLKKNKFKIDGLKPVAEVKSSFFLSFLISLISFID